MKLIGINGHCCNLLQSKRCYSDCCYERIVKVRVEPEGEKKEKMKLIDIGFLFLTDIGHKGFSNGYWGTIDNISTNFAANVGCAHMANNRETALFQIFGIYHKDRINTNA